MSYQNKYVVKAKAIIYKGELDYISRCVLDYPDIETGGDLFGFWTYSGYPVIQYVIGPGKRSNHQVAFFNQDIDYLKEVGNALRQAHGLQHIGEWHSHHRLGLAEPSGHDITTVTKAIYNYNLGKFFLVITNVRESSSGINGFMFNKEQGRVFDYVGWVVLNNDSPIRDSFDRESANLVYKPRTNQASITDLTPTTLSDTEFVKPEYSPEYWLSDKSNHKTLKNIIDGLSGSVEEIQVFQNNEDKSIYLMFRYKGKSYSLSFSQDFPQSKPVIRELTNEREATVDTSDEQWDSELEISKSTLVFTKNVLRISSKNFFQKILSK
jgi:hypothetical protein